VTGVTAVIGNYNGERFLTDCIESLKAQTLAPAQIIVVDGASTDASVAIATDLGAHVIEETNDGLGRLYNRGVREARTDYVFLANNDIAAEPECFQALVSTLDNDPLAFASDARQLDWAGERTIHAKTTLSRGRMLREHLPGFHLDHQVNAQAVTETVCANGASMLVRRASFLKLGGFDETFFMEWEDLDLCWRAWLTGLRTLYVPDAVVRHRVGAVTTRALQPRRSASSHHNLVRFALKCLPLTAAARIVGGEILRLAAHPRAVSSGLAAVLPELPDILRQRRAVGPSQELLDSLLVRHQ
jgi:GT2 family glycosyltransferase